VTSGSPKFKRTVSEDDLSRLKREREQADVLYNDVLADLDGAIQRLREMPHPPPGYDEHEIGALNETWDLQAVGPDSSGWRGRLLSLVWSLVGPLFERQQAFNSVLVEHINRNIPVHRGVTESITSTVAILSEELARAIAFQTKLVQFSQQITPYVDTKDREVAGLMRRINEDIEERAEHLRLHIAGLAGTINEVADEVRKRSESALIRERLLESRVDDLRSTSSVAHRVTQTLKRELERLQSSSAATPRPETDATPPQPTQSALDSYKYVGFEDDFRGPPDDIRKRLESYLPFFQGAADVLDAGCGRGEFLELLRDRGISARGVDLNHEMVEECRARGLTVDESDLLSYLRRLPDGSLGGLLAAQVVEHLEPSYLLQVLDAAFHALRPGSTLILETINVASWSAFFQSYIRDITHVRPLHPDTLRYLVSASGFQKIEVSFSSPCPDQNLLELVPPLSQEARSTAGPLANLIVAFNENAEKLNGLLFADLDYAIIATRP
jgi:O-antigen chain-terminating methyltransferase